MDFHIYKIITIQQSILGNYLNEGKHNLNVNKIIMLIHKKIHCKQLYDNQCNIKPNNIKLFDGKYIIHNQNNIILIK